MIANHNRLYHLGMTAVAKSTLADAMNRRNPEMFRELFEEILARATECTAGHKFRFHNLLHAIDITTIDLCLNQYDWSHYRKHKGAIKLYTELDLNGNLPCFVVMSNGKMSDIRAAKENIAIFLNHIDISLTEITDRIRDTLMQNMSLLEVLSWTRKTILKPPDWN